MCKRICVYDQKSECPIKGQEEDCADCSSNPVYDAMFEEQTEDPDEIVNGLTTGILNQLEDEDES
jgi:hypothetical protein